jgi:hypothetical protein
MDYIRIDNDMWADHGMVYTVLEYSKPLTSSSAVHLVLENRETKEITRRVVAEHQIEWIDEKDI